MGKLNKMLAEQGVYTRTPLGVIRSESRPSGYTANGAPGFARDPRSELFLLAVTNFVGEDTAVERAGERDARYGNLITFCTGRYPRWTLELLTWLRAKANLRSAAVVGGVYAAHALWKAGYTADVAQGVTVRQFVNAVLQRPDEPGDFVAFWFTTFGRKLPIGVKRGVGDAIVRLYTQRNVIKYDSPRKLIRFADVIEFSQITRDKGDHSGLFAYLLDERHGRGEERLAHLDVLARRKEILATPPQERAARIADPAFTMQLDAAGMTWEDVAGWAGPLTADVWHQVIPLMRPGALLKNLNNFDRVGIDKRFRQVVVDRLTDPQLLTRARLMPMDFLKAYRNLLSDHWKAALDEAATLSLRNVPLFAGRTLILVDTSGSMTDEFTRSPGRSRPTRAPAGWPQGAQPAPLQRWEVASLFGIAMARNCEQADVVSYSSAGYWVGNRATATAQRVTGSVPFPLVQGENLLAAVARFRRDAFIGGGTDTAGAIARHWQPGYRRLVLLTDEQANPHGLADIFKPVPAGTPVYTFNLAGYEHGHAADGPNRYTIGGLTDQAYKMIYNIETVTEDACWPWDVPDAVTEAAVTEAAMAEAAGR